MLLGLFLAWFIATVREALHTRVAEKEGENVEATLAVKPRVALVCSALGLVLTRMALTLCAYPPKSGILDRRRGAVLLALYIVYTVVLLQLRTGQSH